MSQPMYPPPPPSPPPPPGGGYGAPPGGYGAPPPMGGGGAQMVQGPAMGLMVHGGVGILFGLIGLVANIFGVGMSGLSSMGGGGAADQYAGMMSGGIGIVSGIVGLAACGFILWAGMQARQLRGYQMAMIASIVSIVPCFGCCLIGIPVGIWALVTLMKPEVKAAFTS